MKNKKSNLYVGVDLQQSSLRLVVVEKKSKKIVAHEEHLITEISEGLNLLKQRISQTPCAIAFPHTKVILKNLDLARDLEDNEILAFLHFHAEEYFLINSQEIYIEYEYIHDTKTRIRAVAVKKKDIAELIEQFQIANINLQAIHVDALVIENLINRLKIGEKTFAAFLISEESVIEVLVQNRNIEHAYTSSRHDNTLKSLASKIQRCIRWHHSTQKESFEVEMIFLLGTNVPESFCAVLASELKIPIKVFSNLLNDEALREPRFDLSRGLVLCQ